MLVSYLFRVLQRRCTTCRRLIRTGDPEACRDPRPHNESALAIPTGERHKGDLLRAALSKEAALISPPPPRCCCAAHDWHVWLGARGRWTGNRAGGCGRTKWVVWQEHWAQPSRSRAASRVSFVLLLRVCCVDCTCVGPRIDAISE